MSFPTGRCCENGFFGQAHDCRKQQSAGAAPREWWLLQEQGSNRALLRELGEKWPNDIGGEPSPEWQHVVEFSAYLAIERELAYVKNQMVNEIQSGTAWANGERMKVIAERDELSEALKLQNSILNGSREQLTQERDRLRGALEKIAAGGTVTRRMCEDIAQAALKAESTDWQGPTQAEIAHAMRPGQGVD